MMVSNTKSIEMGWKWMGIHAPKTISSEKPFLDFGLSQFGVLWDGRQDGLAGGRATGRAGGRAGGDVNTTIHYGAGHVQY